MCVLLFKNVLQIIILIGISRCTKSSLILAKTAFQSQECPVLLGPDPPLISVDTDENHRIVGARTVSHSLTHYAAYFRTIDNYFCSGVMVAPKIVLSAAHCNLDNKSIAYIGGSEKNKPTEIEIDHIITSTRHSKESYGIWLYDFSLVVLKSSVPDHIKFMKVNANSSNPQDGSVVRMIGYGRFQLGLDKQQEFLHQVDIPTQPSTVCNASSPYNKSIHICAGYTKGGCGTCHGDSGGPVVQYDQNQRPVVVGIVSFAQGCGEPNGYSYSSRVSLFSKEIFQKYPSIELTNSTVNVPFSEFAVYPNPTFQQLGPTNPSPSPNANEIPEIIIPGPKPRKLRKGRSRGRITLYTIIALCVIAVISLIAYCIYLIFKKMRSSR